MKNPALSLCLAVALSCSIVGCTPKETPETECDAYVAARKKDGWPADAAVKKACVAELAALEKGGDEEAWKGVKGCFGEGVTVDQSHDCAEVWIKGDAKTLGFAEEGSGEWAQGSPKKLDAEACRDGAFVIAQRKLGFGLFKTKGEAKTHREQLEKVCNEQKGDAAYAANFACMRKAKKQQDLAACVSAPASAP